MVKRQNRTLLTQESYNPFEVVDNSQALKANLNAIDDRDIRCKFKATEDPIQYVFDSFDNTSLKTLAKDFVREGLSDMVSFITRIVNN